MASSPILSLNRSRRPWLPPSREGVAPCPQPRPGISCGGWERAGLTLCHWTPPADPRHTCFSPRLAGARQRRRSALARRLVFVLHQTVDRGSWHDDMPPNSNAGDGAAGDGGVCGGAWNPEGHCRLRYRHGQPRGGHGLKDPVRHWLIIARPLRWRRGLGGPSALSENIRIFPMFSLAGR